MLPPQDMHILGIFGDALQAVRNDLLTMSSIAQRNFTLAMKGVLERDTELCNQVIADDEDVDQFEKGVDRECLEIIVRFNPKAHDLRQVMSSMKMAQNLERVSDEAVNIARKGRKLNKHPAMPEVKLIEPVYQKALEMLEESIRAFAEADTALAASLKPRDKELNAEHKRVTKELVACMEQGTDGEGLKSYLNLIFIVRFLERIGDHSVNIGEETIFTENAVDIRHGGPGQ